MQSASSMQTKPDCRSAKHPNGCDSDETARETRASESAARPPRVEVVIEVPRWSFLKRGSNGEIDFLSPIPCPFNYGSIHDYVGLDGDPLDALVLGPRLPLGARVQVTAFGAVSLTDRGITDDKLVCSSYPLTQGQRRMVLSFFGFYARFKHLLNIYRGRPGQNFCGGWGNAWAAIERAEPRDGSWKGSRVPF